MGVGQEEDLTGRYDRAPWWGLFMWRRSGVALSALFMTLMGGGREGLPSGGVGGCCFTVGPMIRGGTKAEHVGDSLIVA